MQYDQLEAKSEHIKSISEQADTRKPSILLG